VGVNYLTLPSAVVYQRGPKDFRKRLSRRGAGDVPGVRPRRSRLVRSSLVLVFVHHHVAELLIRAARMDLEASRLDGTMMLPPTERRRLGDRPGS
jgi:hypothetical protein